jgi:hypothetical protein
LEKKEQEYLSAQAQAERNERYIQELRYQIEQATEKVGYYDGYLLSKEFYVSNR